MDPEIIEVNCPTCGKTVVWGEQSPYRPFCCKRCQLIDLGEWADEVRNQGMRYAREAANRGRDYVEETFSGDEAQFSRHESEFGSQGRDVNRH